MSYAGDKWDATRASEGAPCAYCGYMVQPGDWTCFGCWPLTRHHNVEMDGAVLANKRMLGLEDFGDDWHCHTCSLGDRTKWDPAVGCPNYPCGAFKPGQCRACPQCGWVL